jgi:glutathione S-transferase
MKAYHIPVCPFCQRLEILLDLKGQTDAVDFDCIDITKPRPDWLLELTGGSTSLPVLVTDQDQPLKESLVLMRYLDGHLPGQVMRNDPYEHAVEELVVTREGAFTGAGYRFVMNQDPAKRDEHRERMLSVYADLDALLRRYNPDGTWLFEEFGFAEAVYTPMFMRFWFLEYYEDFELPDEPTFERVRRWRDACLEHPAAQQVTAEEINKLYYDYAKGAGNGALLEGREVSSFTFDPNWSERPMPPNDKYGHSATDQELGLV